YSPRRVERNPGLGPIAVLASDFDFDLPKSAIALRPASPRDSARLLVVKPGEKEPLSQRVVHMLPELLLPGDVMVFNDTKVLPAELTGWRTARNQDAEPVRVSLTLIERLTDGRWRALIRPGKRLRDGDRIVLESEFSRSVLILSEKRDNGEAIV